MFIRHMVVRRRRLALPLTVGFFPELRGIILSLSAVRTHSSLCLGMAGLMVLGGLVRL